VVKVIQSRAQPRARVCTRTFESPCIKTVLARVVTQCYFLPVGYGHISPSTTTGRAITIVYAIFGIPMFLILLADFGKLFTRGIKFVWAFVRRVYYTGSCRKVRRTVPVQVSQRQNPLAYCDGDGSSVRRILLHYCRRDASLLGEVLRANWRDILGIRNEYSPSGKASGLLVYLLGCLNVSVSARLAC
jgi:hypothetical protein